MKHPFRRKNLSLSLIPCYVAAALAFALAEPTPLGFAAGGVLICAGQTLRLWGAGHLVKNDRLVVTGPYAHLQHPLYAGTLLLGAGFGIVAGAWGIALAAGLFLPLFFLYYFPYKERVERARLERRYGAAYLSYRASVPMLLPSLARWSPPRELAVDGDWRWSRDRFRDNGELGTLVGVLLGLGLLALRPALPI